jgi:hypothetical protein
MHDRKCTEIDIFPNATVSEFGITYQHDVEAVKAEIFARGPVATGVSGAPLTDYYKGERQLTQLALLDGVLQLPENSFGSSGIP